MRTIISEQILRILAGGNRTRDERWDIREINLLVNQERDRLIRRDYLQDKQLDMIEEVLSSVDDALVTPYEDVAVLKDENKDLWYSELSGTPLHSKSFMQVSLMQSQYDPFIPITPSMAGILYNTSASDIGGNTAFWREGKRVYYYNLHCPTPKKVLIKMVAKSSSLSDSNFNVPSHLEMEIIANIVQLLGSRMQDNQDYKNDNISK